MEEAGKEIELLLRLVPDAEEEGQDVSRKPGVDNIVSRVLDSSGSGVEAVVRIVRLGVEQHAGAPGGCRVGRPVRSSGFFALMVFRVSRTIRSLRLSFSIARRILSASHWDVRSRGGGGESERRRVEMPFARQVNYNRGARGKQCMDHDTHGTCTHKTGPPACGDAFLPQDAPSPSPTPPCPWRLGLRGREG